jgi:imidazolonepropionase-like amidohydrolase
MKIRLAIVPRATPRLGGVERLRGGSEVPIDYAASRPPAAEQIRLFGEARGTLLAATDVGVPMQIPRIFLHKNLALLVDAGLTPLEALRAATLNPARVLDMEGSLGIIG